MKISEDVIIRWKLVKTGNLCKKLKDMPFNINEGTINAEVGGGELSSLLNYLENKILWNVLQRN